MKHCRSQARQSAGFTVAELAIAQLLMAIIGLALVVLYNQSYMVLNRGSVKTYQQQTAREAVKRIVPRITSAVPPQSSAPYALPAIYAPLKVPDDEAASTDRQIVLSSSASYVAELMNQAPVTFDPRQPQYAMYRIFFEVDDSKDQTDPESAPGGRIGNVLVDAYTPDDPNDDIIIARNLYDVTFQNTGDSVVRLSVQVYGHVQMATGQRELKRVDYTTRIHLPYYTVEPGGP